MLCPQKLLVLSRNYKTFLGNKRPLFRTTLPPLRLFVANLGVAIVIVLHVVATLILEKRAKVTYKVQNGT